MPTVRGGRNIVPVDIYEEIYTYYAKQSKIEDKSLKAIVNDVLAMNIERNKFLKDIAPHLKKTVIETDYMILFDSKLRKSFTVIVKDCALVCQEDRSTDCEHTHYAWALPELIRLNIKKPPSAPKD